MLSQLYRPDGTKSAGGASDAGRAGRYAPVVAQNGPSRDVKLTFAQLRRRRAAWCYVALTRTAALSWYAQR